MKKSELIAGSTDDDLSKQDNDIESEVKIVPEKEKLPADSLNLAQDQSKLKEITKAPKRSSSIQDVQTVLRDHGFASFLKYDNFRDNFDIWKGWLDKGAEML